ncbi:MAG: 1,2-dihydroxy-3-keto-5-methylthiopentene dioxygenase [Acidimicrobiia bacterium]
MTMLVTWADDDPDQPLERTTDERRIADRLGAVGIGYERWPIRVDLDAGVTADDVLAAYRDEVDRLVTERGFTVVDVAQLRPSDDADWPATAAGARSKFLEEHTHAEDEVRFFVHGSGIFYLHIADRVHAVLCEAGDLLSVPAATTHWFDMGTRPDFAAIRFSRNPDGWVGEFTGDPIARSFADFDTLAAWT